MTSSIYDQQRIHNYLLNRLSTEEEQIFEEWLLDTPGALEQITLEQTIIKSASQLEKSTSRQTRVCKVTPPSHWKKRLFSYLLPTKKLSIALAFTCSLFAVSYLSYTPSQQAQYASQTIYIEQLRSAHMPTIQIQSLDDTQHYQLLILLDDIEPPAFTVSIFNRLDNRVIFKQTVTPNHHGELPVLISKNALTGNDYILKIMPATNAQPLQFLLEIQ